MISVLENPEPTLLSRHTGAVLRATFVGLLTILTAVVFAGCTSKGTPSAGPPVAETQPDRPELPPVYQVGHVVDLLAFVDPQRDAVLGNFGWDAGRLVIPPARAAQLNLDFDVPDQYQLTLEVARVRGNESLNLGIPVGGRQTGIVIEGWGQGISGLNRVDGQLAQHNVTSNRFPVFTDTTPRQIRILVRRESVLVDVDNNVFIDFRGDPTRLDFDARFFQEPRPDQLMIGGWESEFVVSKWTLTPFGDAPVDYSDTPPPRLAQGERGPADSPEVTGTLGAASENVANTGSSSSSPTTTPSVSPGPGSSPTIAAQDASNGAAAGATREAPHNSAESASKRVPDPVWPWAAELDPFPGWSGEVASNISVPVTSGLVVLPDGPSPYFLVGTKLDRGKRWTIHDVRSGEPVGTPCDLVGDYYHLKPGPSGQYLKSYVGVANARRVFVHSFVTGEVVHEAASPNLRPNSIHADFLAANEQLLEVRLKPERVEFNVVSLRTGESIAQWESEQSSSEYTYPIISPGGRYVLVKWNDILTAYELSTGQVVGRRAIPEGLRFATTMAFSRDGAEVALVGASADRDSPYLWCLDWATGETLMFANVRADLEIDRSNYELGPALHYFPEKQMLLLFGQDVIDRQTGKFCFAIPQNAFWQNPRRPLGPQSILGMEQGGMEQGGMEQGADLQVYRVIELNPIGLQQALDVVRSGGIAADVGLPPLAAAADQAGRLVPPFEKPQSVPPTIQPYARPSPPSSPELPIRIAQFRDPYIKLRRIELADPPATSAVAHFTLDNGSDGDRQDHVMRFDLMSGKLMSAMPIRRDFRLAAVSPNGQFALLGLFNEVDGYSRLDVVDMVNQDHVAGWRPFDNEPRAEDVSAAGQPEAKNPMTATWVRFSGNVNVLTVNPVGKLICWQLPDGVPRYVCHDFGNPLAQSEDRRYVATVRENLLCIFDAQAGAWVGSLEPEEPPLKVLRAGFAPDNGQLAAVLRYQGRNELAIWDLAQGKQIQQFELPYHTVNAGWSEHQHQMHRQIGLDFRRDGYLTLDDLYLIDLANESVPWRIQLRRGKHAVNALDRREWYTEYIRTSRGDGQVFEFWLAASAMPSDDVIARLKTYPAEDDIRGTSILAADGEAIELKAE